MKEFIENNPSTFWKWFAFCAVVSLFPIWSLKYLPMTDLPQHAAQISIINNLHNPVFNFEPYFELHWFIPYSLIYFLTSLVARVVGVLPALKIVLTLAMIGLPLSIFYYFRQTDGDPWWSLIGFPLFYGFNFYWGFLNYIVAIPFGFLSMGYCHFFAREPTLRKGIVFSLLHLMLFFSHALAFGFCTIMNLIILWFGSKNIKSFIAASLPLMLSVPLVLVWYLLPQNSVPSLPTNSIAWFVGFSRFKEFFFYLLNYMPSRPFLFMSFLLLAIVLLSAKFEKVPPVKIAIFAAGFLLFMFMPHHMMNISLIYPRYIVFVLILGISMLHPSGSAVRRIVSRGLTCAFVFGWMVFLCFAYRAYDADVRNMEKLIEVMEPGKNVLALLVDGGRNTFSFFGANHAAAWYQVEKGGVYSFSFAYDYKSVARFKPDSPPMTQMGNYQLRQIELFKLPRYDVFDYYVLRCRIIARASFLAEGINKLYLVKRIGNWSLYKKPARKKT